MVVMKFGGSSVATSAALARVRCIVEAERRPRVVVVSALGGVTDALIALTGRAASRDLTGALEALRALRDRHASLAAAVGAAVERRTLLARLDAQWQDVETLVRSVSLVGACSPAASDAIVAHGELASSRLVAAVLADAGLPAAWVDARSVIVTDGRHQEAAPLIHETSSRLSGVVGALIARGAVPVVGGFIGATSEGVTSTLGRGGSDYSASLVGACLGAAEIQIWTDVDGILTADPRICARARPVERLSFGEASALARFGAKVLHPSTVQPAVRAGIPVRILNSCRPSSRGTLVAHGPVRRVAPAAGIACLRNLCAFDTPLPDGAGRHAALAAVFEACARASALVHLAAVSDAGVSVAVDDGPAAARLAAQLDAGPGAARRDGLALVAAVGDGFATGHAETWRVLAALDTIPVHLLSRAPGSNHVAAIVDERDLAFAVASLHADLFERRSRPDHAEGGPDANGRPFPALARAGREARA